MIQATLNLALGDLYSIYEYNSTSSCFLSSPSFLYLWNTIYTFRFKCQDLLSKNSINTKRIENQQLIIIIQRNQIFNLLTTT